MDLARMLHKCRRDQWTVHDLDWNVPPPRLPRAKEEAVVQYFTDMAGIELLAAALFEAQGRKTSDPILREIFATFVTDEERHADVAARLARHYDVHRYRAYELDGGFVHFRPHFLAAIEYLPPEIANGYVTAGELLLDVALLRSLDDYVDDAMSHRAMELINRDESRHIAIDFHMVEVYCSDEFLAQRHARPRAPLADRARGAWALGHMLWYAAPFLRNVFLRPLDVTDPEGRRLREAFKRIQLVTNKPTVARMPMSRLVLGLQRLYNHPLLGAVFGRALLRGMGADERFARILYTDEELARAQRMSFDELAEEATASKYRA